MSAGLFDDVLVLVAGSDDDERAILRAARSASKGGGAVTLLHVVEGLPAGVERWIPGASAASRAARESWASQLEEMAAPLREKGIPVRVQVAAGRRAAETARAAKSGGHGVVVLAAGLAQGGGLDGREMRLVRRCPAAVWAVGPGEIKLKRVLAAVVPEPPGRPRRALNLRILETAKRIAQEDKAELRVFHAWNVPGESILRTRLEPKEWEQAITFAERQATEGMEELVEAAGGVPERSVHVVRGDAREELLTFVRREKIDLVVMGSLHDSEVAGTLIGSTAEHVLDRITCSVLAMKPEGFVGPFDADA